MQRWLHLWRYFLIPLGCVWVFVGETNGGSLVAERIRPLPPVSFQVSRESYTNKAWDTSSIVITNIGRKYIDSPFPFQYLCDTHMNTNWPSISKPEVQRQTNSNHLQHERKATKNIHVGNEKYVPNIRVGKGLVVVSISQAASLARDESWNQAATRQQKLPKCFFFLKTTKAKSLQRQAS